jgi:hypothetical protein
MTKFYQNPDLCQNVRSAQISPIQQTGHSPIVITRNPLTIWSHGVNHWKSGRVTWWYGIWQSGSFNFA